MASLRTISSRGLRRLASYLQPRFTCPICNYHGPFQAVDPPTGYRQHARCPRCGAAERHRLQFLVVSALLNGRDLSFSSVLHVAPEPSFQKLFRERFGSYVSLDLLRDDVDVRADLTELPFEDGRFQMVFASHVLEHIADDRKALSEIRRILAPGGLAVLPVPVVCERTIEYQAPNPFETDHVRAPGSDYFERYQSNFSRVQVFDSDSFPAYYQCYVYEDRSRYPTQHSPQRTPVPGKRHLDYVPVCFV